MAAVDFSTAFVGDSYAAAGTIRKMLKKELDVSSLTLLDMTNEQPAFIGRMETHTLFTLCTADEQTLKSCPDINTQILESIMKMRKSAPSTLEELCTSVLWLHDGEVRMIGTPQEVLPVYEEFMS